MEWMWGYPLKHKNLPSGCSLKKVISIFQQLSAASRCLQRDGTETIDLIYFVIWAGLILCRPCAGNHSHWEFLSEIVMLCPKGRISLHPCWSLGSLILFAFFSVKIPKPERKWGVKMCTNMSHLGLSSQSPSSSLPPALISALTNNHCKKKLL